MLVIEIPFDFSKHATHFSCQNVHGYVVRTIRHIAFQPESEFVVTHMHPGHDYIYTRTDYTQCTCIYMYMYMYLPQKQVLHQVWRPLCPSWLSPHPHLPFEVADGSYDILPLSLSLLVLSLLSLSTLPSLCCSHLLLLPRLLPLPLPLVLPTTPAAAEWELAGDACPGLAHPFQVGSK